MTNEQRKVYQTVIFASLLHDIGKFLHRHPEAKEDHEYHSTKYVEELSTQFATAEWFNTEMLKELVEYHSKPGKVRDEWKAYAKLVYLADSYSSGERDTDQSHAKETSYKNKPLDSIFSLIKLDGKIRPIDIPTNDGRRNTFRHNLTKLDPSKAFPVPIKKSLERDEIPALVDEFKKQVSKISSEILFDNFFITFLSLLEQYLWCVPSDTRYEISDIALYDHLKSSSALAACLFKFYFENEDSDKKIRKDQDEFILVGGELRGIQNYIYNIAASIEGKIAKRLRARSFFITAIVDVITHKILHDLELPFSCNLITAGGHFQMLIPNTSTMIEKIEKSALEIDEWLFENYFGEINISLTWKKEDQEIVISKSELKILHFFKEAEKLHDQLDELAFNKFKFHFTQDQKWNPDAFKINDELYKKYKEPCEICHKFPVEYEDDDETKTKTCKMCHLDRIIGKNLANAKYIVYSTHQIKNDSLFIFDKYYITLIESNKQIDTDKKIYLVQSLTDHIEDASYKTGMPIVRRFLANHIPIIENEEEHKKELCRFCVYNNDCDFQKTFKAEDPYTFSCLAALSVDKNTQKGNQLIGILKVDIDRLGYIFSRGFKDLKENDQIDRVTISRYLTLSRMIDLFFCGWVQYTIANNERFKKIYSVFSGGDDLLVIGPWETIIEFSYHLYTEFKRYVCESESIKISAGIAIIKPKFPIARGATLANELLEISKNAGRNRITLFGVTVEWDYFKELLDFKDKLIEKMKPYLDTEQGTTSGKKSEFTTAFLYRLLYYRNMYLDFKNHNSIRGLLYCSKLIYDVNRNIYEIKWEKGRRVIKNEARVKEVIDKIFKFFLFIPGKNKKALIEYINIPVVWALYKNRGGKNYDG